jgi:hypothetical protein
VAVAIDQGRWSDTGIVGCDSIDDTTLADLSATLRRKVEERGN